MNSHILVHPAVPRRVTGILAALTMAGIIGIVVTAVLGFEEPSTPMLLVSGVMALAAPLAVLVHLRVTRGPTQDEKRIWLKEFLSAQLARRIASN